MLSLTCFPARQLVFNAEGKVTGKTEIHKSQEKRIVHDAYYQREANREALYRMLPIQTTNSQLLYRTDVKDNGSIE